MGPTEQTKEKKSWIEIKNEEALFPSEDAGGVNSDLISSLNDHLDQLEDLCGRFAFSLREISHVMKIKPSKEH